MNEPQSPVLTCRPLPAFDSANWNDVAQAFAGAQSCELSQYWLGQPHPQLQPATVRTGWIGQDLWVYAELTDLDIYNEATRLNEMTYEMGDVFELFLRPLPQEHYFEFHVTPENQKLQLHLPGAGAIEAIRDGQHTLQEFMMPEIAFYSQTKVLPSQQQWQVLAKVEASVTVDAKTIKPGDEWLFSFSRYDYTRGTTAPVVSSTSPHIQLNFHRQQEWGRLIFAD
jgi:hypothetical protein